MAATSPLGFVQRHHLKMDNSTGYVTLLRACAKNRDLCKGTRLHDDILRLGLVNQCSDALATMYAKCGALSKAKTTLEAHKSKDVLTWTALISAYTERGGGQNALDCFEQMRSQEICPDAVTFATILKACGIVGAADKGEMIHDNIIRQGLLEKDIVLGGAVVHMYAKCGALAKAQKVLDELPIRNVVSWSAIIAGYAQHGQADQALNCFERMLSEGHSPNPVTFSCILKACGSLKAADRGAKIHDQIVRQGLLGNNVVLSNALIDMYVKCGALAKALQVMEDLRVRDVISWSALIAGFAQQDQGQLALKLFESMQDEGVSPDEMTLACILKVCGRLEAADKGVEVHNEIVRQGLETNIVLGNGLVDMYVKFGALLKAERIFEELPLQDVNSWNALIRGYVQESRDEQALKCYEQMQHEGVSPDAVTFSHILPACASLGAYEKGEKIHYEIDRQGLLNSDLVLGNAIVHMYAKCGDLVKAQQVLDNLPVHNFDTWSAIIIEGYAQHAQSEQVLNCFEQMQEEGFCPNAEIYACTLKACGRMGAVDKGQAIHEEIATKGFLGNNVTLIFCLVDMYANCGAHGKAREVLEQLHVDADISWSALIIAYAQHGQGEKALFCYKCMQREGILPNAAAYTQILKVYDSIGALDKAEETHDEILRQGLLDSDCVLATSFIDMYVKSGDLEKAAQVLEELALRDVVSWSALMTGYIHQAQGEHALDCFENMQHEGLSPDAVTFSCALKACGTISAAEKGAKIHIEVIRRGMLDNHKGLGNVSGHHVVLGNSLLDMYAKCGAPVKAQQVLKELPVRDVVSWTAVIGGYVQYGQSEQALTCFKYMQHEGLSPDAAVFSCILSACSLSCLLKDAQTSLATMSMYHMRPTLEHYTCVVDLFGRAGLLDKALEVIGKMPLSSIEAWCALMHACQKWGDAKVGRWAFQRVEQMGKKDAIPYIFLAYMHAAPCMQNNVENIEAKYHLHCKASRVLVG